LLFSLLFSSERLDALTHLSVRLLLNSFRQSGERFHPAFVRQIALHLDATLKKSSLLVHFERFHVISFEFRQESARGPGRKSVVWICSEEMLEIGIVVLDRGVEAFRR
jgi:hypothetical protein